MAKSPYPNLILLLLLLLRFPFSSSTIPLGSVLYASGSNQSWSSPNFTFSVSFLPSSSPNSFLAAVSFAGKIPTWSTGSVDSRGSLRLSSSGSLRLTNGSNATVWDSGTDGLGVVLASIEDSGNLRLLDNQSNPVWSSFDHPTDTIVQLQNFTAGKVLRSGNYSFQLERRGNLTLKWNNSTTYWSQGLNSSFSSNLSSPSLALQTNGVVLMFDSTLSGGTETIYSDDYGEGSNTFRFLKLDDDGNLRIYSSASRNSGPLSPHWSALANQCLVYGYCGNFGICSYNDTTPVCLCPSRNFDLVDVSDRRKGCKRKVELNDCSGNATMLDLGNTRLVADSSDPNSEVFFAGSSPCRSNCLVSTTCLASVSLSDGSGNCWQKQRGSFFTGYQSSSVPSTSYVKVCGPVLPNQPLVGTKGDGNNSKVHLWIVAVALVGGLLGLALVCGGAAAETIQSLELCRLTTLCLSNTEAILDKRLGEDQTVDMEQVKRMVQTSFWCTQEQPLQRPTMGKVVQMIEGITAINKPPRPKTLNEVSFSGSSGSTSHASILVASGPTRSSSSSATRSFQTMGITSSSTKIGQGSLLGS
ncbi:hypothetical protein HID58_028968 [Brassica napus]|uniref:Bulb-type lectin domain-containing protein n=1 Tax=Brassica napus TaxID=3708 RepID=A0ABQ8CBR5_BRANA|nr:hypothetical protein HID58_028968 [Brassica napus]